MPDLMADALLEAKSPAQPIVKRGALAVVTDLFTRFRDTVRDGSIP